MTITSGLDLGLPASPLAEDPKLNAELQIVYNALHNIVQAMNDAGIPAGGISPNPTVQDVSHGGTGVATATGVLIGTGTTAMTAVAGGTVGQQLRVKTIGPTTYEFSSSGTGDVVGPAGAVSGNVAVYDGITGKLLKDGGTLGTAAFTDATAYVPANAPVVSGGELNAYAAGANGLSLAADVSALITLVQTIRTALVANGIMS